MPTVNIERLRKLDYRCKKLLIGDIVRKKLLQILPADLAAGNAANNANAKVIAPLKTSKVPFKELFSAIRVFNSEAS